MTHSLYEAKHVVNTLSYRKIIILSKSNLKITN